MRILVTGSAGFIGQHLCQELLDPFNTIIYHDLIHGDLTQPGVADQRIREEKPDVVVHLAAKVGRLFGEDDPAATVHANAGMTANVAKACGEHGARLVYASTSEVYGDQGQDPQPAREDETASGRIHNIYGLSKKHGEEVCELYAPEGLTIIRLSMPFGPGLPAGRGRAAMINFLYNALHRQPIQVHLGAERSWCWIGDTVRAIRTVIEKSDGGVFNVGRDDNAVSMLELARRACDFASAPHSLIEEVDAPERQTVVKRLSTERVRALGWKPEVDLDEGMWRTLQWVKQQPPPAQHVAA